MVPGTTSRNIDKHILLSDIVGSSRLQEKYPHEYTVALDKHNTLIEQTVVGCGGEVFKSTGDGYFAFFESAHECIACAAKLAIEFDNFPAASVEGAGFIDPSYQWSIGPCDGRGDRGVAL